MKDLRAERRSQIILSAIEVFGEHGFYKGRVEDIALNAGIGKGTIYEYFSSKEDIFKEMLQYMFHSYTEALRKAARDKTSLRCKLIAILDLRWKFMMEHKHNMEANFLRFGNITNLIRPFIIEINKNIFEMILKIVEKAIEEGEIHKDLDPEKVTVLLLSALSSCEISKISLDSDQMDSEAMINMIFQGISS